jgi:hypothetical protein
MENTNTVQFENDQPEWHIASGEQFQGPFKMSEVYQKLVAQEWSWVQFAYREADGHWMRLCDLMILKALQPSMPKGKPVAPTPPLPKIEDRYQWFLYQNDNQTGPYPTAEIKRLIASGQVLEQAHVWREGFENWQYVKDVKELFSVPVATPKAPPVAPAPAPVAVTASAPMATEQKNSEKRGQPRRPLVAQVYLTNQSEVITGLCRDISVGGMQMQTDRVPGEVGATIRLNVVPPSSTGLKPFVAEGVIVRILEDRRGFAFRFQKLDSEAKSAIESYIAL